MKEIILTRKVILRIHDFLIFDYILLLSMLLKFHQFICKWKYYKIVCFCESHLFPTLCLMVQR